VNANVYHYRDSTNLEIDAIVELPNQDWIAFEIKLGSETGIQEAKDNFRKLKNRLSESKLSRCKSFNVITSEGESYTDTDGVNIISLGHLFIK
jgi:predicted AAA+ superfamily ATPase